MSVPLFDTATALAPLREELRAAVARVLDSERYILGPEVDAFEREFAAHCGAGHAVGVANGTEAITIALRAMGVGPGDEVVVPSFTFYASAEAIPPTGARPVFCDIDPDTYCVTAETVKAAITTRTKAVIAVHLFGNVAPVAEIEALGVPVLEDAAQAAGSRSPAGRPGALGTAATFSFFPSKNLGCFGDGGMVTTSDPELAERVRVLRFHGSHDKITYEQVGYNSRLDELQAAVLRVQLPHLEDWARGRREAAEHYVRAGLGEEEEGRAAHLRLWRRARMAPVRHRPLRCASPGRGPERGGDRRSRLLPHARAPSGGDARVGVWSGAGGDRAGGRQAPGDPDEPRVDRDAGAGGRRGDRCRDLTGRQTDAFWQGHDREHRRVHSSPHPLLLHILLHRGGSAPVRDGAPRFSICCSCSAVRSRLRPPLSPSRSPQFLRWSRSCDLPAMEDRP